MEQKKRAVSTSQRLGREGELMAARYLTRQGIRLTDKNFRSRQGEIDLIGWQGSCLVFVEVKYRKGSSTGTPESAVTMQKQRKICRCADYYRYLHHYDEDVSFRYDVVAIEGKQLRWHQNAFEHIV